MLIFAKLKFLGLTKIPHSQFTYVYLSKLWIFCLPALAKSYQKFVSVEIG